MNVGIFVAAADPGVCRMGNQQKNKKNPFRSILRLRALGRGCGNGACISDGESHNGKWI